MQLRIDGSNLSDHFGNWLLEVAKQEIKKSFNKKKLESFSQYMDITINIPVETFLTKVLEAIVYTIDDEAISIHIDRNTYLVGNIKLETLCRAINFGNTTQKGYPIFTDVFSKIANNINEYVTLYKLTGGNI